MRPQFIVQVGGSSPGSGFYSRLVSATLTDNSGDEADTLELVFDDRNNEIETPAEGKVLEPFFGYLETGLTSKGKFTVAGIGIEGGPDGETLRVQARAADIRDSLKERMTEHFEDTTLGDMLKEVFGRYGMEVAIDGELASIAVEYEARYNQSALAFATALARRYDAVAKPGGGKLVFTCKGKGASASGQQLPQIMILRGQCESWDFDLQPRPRHGRVVAKWFDRAAGKLKFETVSTGGKGPILSLPHTYRSQGEAKKAAEAEGVARNRKTGSGRFTLPGRPSAGAEADVIASGFRDDINGKWRAVTVTHEFSRSGYTTEIEVEAPEQQKGGK